MAHQTNIKRVRTSELDRSKILSYWKSLQHLDKMESMRLCQLRMGKVQKLSDAQAERFDELMQTTAKKYASRLVSVARPLMVVAAPTVIARDSVTQITVRELLKSVADGTINITDTVFIPV